MKFSVALATYNGEKYLREQLDSILSQEFKDFTLYISDDGTLKILDEYAAKDNRIKLFPKHEPNKSACKHFLYMLENIKSDLYLFCDQDDVWTKDHIGIFVEKYKALSDDEKNLPVLVHSDLKIVDSSLNVISPSLFEYSHLPKNPNNRFYFQLNNVTGCACMINNELKNYALKNIATLNENLSKVLMHDHFFATISAEFGKKIFISKATVLYRQHGTNVCGIGEGWNLKSFVKKIFSYSQHKIFAGFFAEYFKEKLPEKEYEFLISYSELEKRCKLSRLLFLARNGFLKTGLIRGVWLCIVG
ncbi:MAG TPA: hypothetical protein DCW73_02135 [Treponema sp.]|nr:hypothetical protein [Treponema sp.]